MIPFPPPRRPQEPSRTLLIVGKYFLKAAGLSALALLAIWLGHQHRIITPPDALLFVGFLLGLLACCTYQSVCALVRKN